MIKNGKTPTFSARGFLSFQENRSRLTLVTVDGLRSADLGQVTIEKACAIASKHGVRVIKDGRIYFGWHEQATLSPADNPTAREVANL